MDVHLCYGLCIVFTLGKSPRACSKYSLLHFIDLRRGKSYFDRDQTTLLRMDNAPLVQGYPCSIRYSLLAKNVSTASFSKIAELLTHIL